jgi:hypothetical protein
MGLFSTLGALMGAGGMKRASRKAETAQLAALDSAIGEQSRQFEAMRSDYSPYLRTGGQALEQESNLIGLNGEGVQASSIEALRGSPIYQSLLRTGEEGLLQNASATGGLRGGNIQRSLADFRADTLARVIEEQLGRLGGLSGRGQQAVGAVSGFGADKAGAVSSLLTGKGAVRAGGLLTRGGINAQNWSNAGSFLDQAVSAALGAGAGAGGAPFNAGQFFQSMVRGKQF